MSVKVYTNPNCVQCDQTKKWLDREDLAYEVVDLSKNPAELEMITELGFTSVPVVITPDDKWSGFRLDRLVLLKVAA